MSESADISNPNLNKEASEYIQNNSSGPEKLIFNLDAAEYKPKELLEYIDDVEAFEEQIKDQIDQMIEKEEEDEVMAEFEKQLNIDDDDDSEDEDKWYPKHRNCPCCHGFVYNCKGKTCVSLGQCHCKMEYEIELYLKEKASHEKNNIKNKKCEKMLN